MASMWDDYTKYSGWDQIMQMLFPSYTNPASGAMPYLSGIGNKADSAFSPYMNTGLNAMSQYYNNASNWATPEGARNNYNTIAGGYSTSPYAKFQQDNMAQYSNQAAAASGMAGTPSQQAALANQINQISSADENNYIDTVMRTQNQGQQGLGDLTHQGFQATTQDVNDWIQQYLAQAKAAYMGQMNQNMSNKMPSGVMSMLPSFMGMF